MNKFSINQKVILLSELFRTGDADGEIAIPEDHTIVGMNITADGNGVEYSLEGGLSCFECYMIPLSRVREVFKILSEDFE